MEIKSIYDEMWDNAINLFEEGEPEIDHTLDYKNDLRRGITLLARPDKKVLDEFENFISDLKDIEPELYFYKRNEFHLTIMSIINCSENFNLSSINLPDYIEKLNQSMAGVKPFSINFTGITASPSCILAQGFPVDNELELSRENIRDVFRESNLYNTIDRRYKIKAAHCTLARFRKNFENKDKLISFLKKNRSKSFGTSKISSLELVYNDWFLRDKTVKTLHSFRI